MPEEEPSPLATRQQLITQALIALAAGRPSQPINPYVARHLSGHVADADAWNELGDRSSALDRLDPAAVTADALRTLFGRAPIPPTIAGVIGGRHQLAGAAM